MQTKVKSLEKIKKNEGKKKGAPRTREHQSVTINVPRVKEIHPSGQHISFDVGLAIAYGVPAAVIYNVLANEIRAAKARDDYKIQGTNWVQLSYRELRSMVGNSLTEKQIKRAVSILIKANVIEKTFHFHGSFNPTSWYSLVEGGKNE